MMKQEHQALWKKIEQFELDEPGAAFPFSEKLARENTWLPSFARVAITEYKKFLLLCCISPQGASPSEVVDKVWHLHLTYTRNYWDGLCGEVLQKQLHHHPSKGGSGEQTKHRNWYRDTYLLYTSVFGEAPPSAIWPAPLGGELLALASDYKTSIYTTLPVWYAAGFIILLFVLSVPGFFNVFNPYSLAGPVFLKFMGVLFLFSTGITVLLLSCKQRKFQQLIHRTFADTNFHYGILELVFGKTRALQTAIVELVCKQILKLTPSKSFINHATVDSQLPSGNPLLIALIQESQNKQQAFTAATNAEYSYEQLKQLYNYDIPDTEETLKIKWLLQQKFRWRWLPYRFVFLLLVIRLLQGLYHHQPVGYLLLGIFLFTIVYGFIIFHFSPPETVKQVLNKKMSESLLLQPNELPEQDMAAAFAYRGSGALAGMDNYTVLASLFAMFPDTSRPGATTGCGSGDGGGGGCGSVAEAAVEVVVEVVEAVDLLPEFSVSLEESHCICLFNAKNVCFFTGLSLATHFVM